MTGLLEVVLVFFFSFLVLIKSSELVVKNAETQTVEPGDKPRIIQKRVGSTK